MGDVLTVTEFDYAAMVAQMVRDSKRSEDRFLHASSDLLGPLRHAQLRIAGAPAKPEPESSMNRLYTGTLWHQAVQRWMQAQGERCMTEVNVEPGLPTGWSGTLDLMRYRHERKAWRLYDLKTQRVEAFAYDGGNIKPDHMWQLTAYLWAADAMGFPMDLEFEVAYVPLNAMTGKHQDLVADVRIGEPLAKQQVWGVMEERWAATEAYLASLPPIKQGTVDTFLTDQLAAAPERAIRSYPEKDGTRTVKLMPTWYASICPYEPPLCTCSATGQTKIGVLELVGDFWFHTPREGWEHIVLPDDLIPGEEIVRV